MWYRLMSTELGNFFLIISDDSFLTENLICLFIKL